MRDAATTTHIPSFFPRRGLRTARLACLCLLALVVRVAGVSGIWPGLSTSGADAAVGAQLYWTDSGNADFANSRVARSNLDGSAVEQLVLPPDAGNPRFLALDPAGGNLYWTDIGTIKRTTLDGGAVATLPISSPCPMGIALSQSERKLYWTDCSLGTINRASSTAPVRRCL